MEFIVELPESRGKRVIWVVTDLFSKQAHFVACRQVPTVEKLARLFIQHSGSYQSGEAAGGCLGKEGLFGRFGSSFLSRDVRQTGGGLRDRSRKAPPVSRLGPGARRTTRALSLPCSASPAAPKRGRRPAPVSTQSYSGREGICAKNEAILRTRSLHKFLPLRGALAPGLAASRGLLPPGTCREGNPQPRLDATEASLPRGPWRDAQGRRALGKAAGPAYTRPVGGQRTLLWLLPGDPPPFGGAVRSDPRCLELPAPAMGENHLKRCQQEAEEVTEIMLDNFSKVLDREGKLSDLDERADELRKQSSAFTKTAKTLAQKKRWDNMKFKIILLAVAVVAILLIILAIVLSFTLSGSGSQVAPAKTSTGGD
ncbi:vesicle-associated membrane protein 5 [Liasis olivaceus]